MTIMVIFPFFRVKFYGRCQMAMPACIAGGLQGSFHGKKIKCGIKNSGLTAQFSWRVTIRVRDQSETVKGGNEPIHCRIRREACLESKDMRREIAKTLFKGVKSRP